VNNDHVKNFSTDAHRNLLGTLLSLTSNDRVLQPLGFCHEPLRFRPTKRHEYAHDYPA
jgi:hypothetical protein